MCGREVLTGVWRTLDMSGACFRRSEMRARGLEGKKQEVERRMQGEWQVQVRGGGQEERAGTEEG